MVLTEAFAAGTPVIASNIAGYSDVVTDGVDGVLVPPADPQRLAEELQRVHHEPERLRAMGEAARAQRRALRLAAGRRAGHRGLRAGDRGARRRSTPPSGCARGSGLRPRRRRPPRARPGGCPRSTRLRERGGSGARAPPAGSALGVAGVLGVGLTALAAQQDRRRQGRREHRPLRRHLGADRLRADGASRCSSAPPPGTAIVRAALPNRPLRRRDVTSATMIGVLMSATLPARLGEPARAMVARAPHRPHARDLPGPARHAGLADGAQHRRPDRCSA